MRLDTKNEASPLNLVSLHVLFSMELTDFRRSLVLGLCSVASSPVRQHLLAMLAHIDHCRVKELRNELLYGWQICGASCQHDLPDSVRLKFQASEHFVDQLNELGAERLYHVLELIS